MLKSRFVDDTGWEFYAETNFHDATIWNFRRDITFVRDSITCLEEDMVLAFISVDYEGRGEVKLCSKCIDGRQTIYGYIVSFRVTDRC